MKGIILIEGPDAAGKTTLAERLAAEYNGIILHQTYRFKNKIPLYYEAVFKKALKLAKERVVILDRLHISEYIYAKVYRKGTKWPWLLRVYNNLFEELNIPIILCIPENVQQGKDWFKKVKMQRKEMYEDIEEVIKEYLKYFENNKNKLIKYNWEKNQQNDLDYKKIKEKIKLSKGSKECKV